MAYKVLQRLKRNLKKYQIFFEKRKLTGNPKNIRLFLYNLFNSTEISFVELYTLPIIIKTEKMLKDLKQYYPLSAYEKKKFPMESFCAFSGGALSGFLLRAGSKK